MIFAQSRIFLLAAVALPALVLFFWWSWRKRRQLSQQFIQARLLPQLTLGISPTIHQWRMTLLTLAAAFLFLALARPLWGESEEQVQQRGLDIIVAIDTSRSMLAEDLAPNRLRRAQLAALDLMSLARTDRLGLVAFAGTAFLQCPLTLDEVAFQQSVNALNTDIIPQGGTALGEAITAAVEAFRKEGDNFRALVVFSDGEDHEAGLQEAVKKAAQAQVRIFTVGVGTANGEVMRARNEDGSWDYVKDEQGNVVKSRLNEAALTDIATATGGFYLPLSGTGAMDVLYEKGLKPLPRAETATRLIRQRNEQFMWPLGIAMLLLVAEVFLPDRKRRGRRKPGLAPTAAGEELRRAVAVFALLLTAASLEASPRSALKSYQSGRYEEARREFERLAEKSPKDARLHYNAGAAAYHGGDFEKAAEHFQAALDPDNLPLQQQSYYNLGNARYRLGESQDDPQQKMEQWKAALQDYDFALKLKPDDEDARFNKELVQKRLEQLQQQQQKQDQNQDQQKDDKDEKEQQQQDPNQDSEQPDQPKRDPSEQEKQDQNKQNQPDQKEQQQNPQQSGGDQADRRDKENESAQKPGESKDESSDSPASAAAQPGQMTLEQVEKLLDALRSEEKAMIFQPPADKQNRPRNRVFKNW